MRALLVLLGLAALVLIVLLSLGMISIDGGRLPQVSVQANVQLQEGCSLRTPTWLQIVSTSKAYRAGAGGEPR